MTPEEDKEMSEKTHCVRLSYMDWDRVALALGQFILRIEEDDDVPDADGRMRKRYIELEDCIREQVGLPRAPN